MTTSHEQTCPGDAFICIQCSGQMRRGLTRDPDGFAVPVYKCDFCESRKTSNTPNSTSVDINILPDYSRFSVSPNTHFVNDSSAYSPQSINSNISQVVVDESIVAPQSRAAAVKYERQDSDSKYREKRDRMAHNHYRREVNSILRKQANVIKDLQENLRTVRHQQSKLVHQESLRRSADHQRLLLQKSRSASRTPSPASNLHQNPFFNDDVSAGIQSGIYAIHKKLGDPAKVPHYSNDLVGVERLIAAQAQEISKVQLELGRSRKALEIQKNASKYSGQALRPQVRGNYHFPSENSVPYKPISTEAPNQASPFRAHASFDSPPPCIYSPVRSPNRKRLSDSIDTKKPQNGHVGQRVEHDRSINHSTAENPAYQDEFFVEDQYYDDDHIDDRQSHHHSSSPVYLNNNSYSNTREVQFSDTPENPLHYNFRSTKFRPGGKYNDNDDTLSHQRFTVDSNKFSIKNQLKRIASNSSRDFLDNDAEDANFANSQSDSTKNSPTRVPPTPFFSPPDRTSHFFNLSNNQMVSNPPEERRDEVHETPSFSNDERQVTVNRRGSYFNSESVVNPPHLSKNSVATNAYRNSSGQGKQFGGIPSLASSSPSALELSAAPPVTVDLKMSNPLSYHDNFGLERNSMNILSQSPTRYLQFNIENQNSLPPESNSHSLALQSDAPTHAPHTAFADSEHDLKLIQDGFLQQSNHSKSSPSIDLTQQQQQLINRNSNGNQSLIKSGRKIGFISSMQPPSSTSDQNSSQKTQVVENSNFHRMSQHKEESKSLNSPKTPSVHQNVEDLYISPSFPVPLNSSFEPINTMMDSSLKSPNNLISYAPTQIVESLIEDNIRRTSVQSNQSMPYFPLERSEALPLGRSSRSTSPTTPIQYNNDSQSRIDKNDPLGTLRSEKNEEFYEQLLRDTIEKEQQIKGGGSHIRTQSGNSSAIKNYYQNHAHDGILFPPDEEDDKFVVTAQDEIAEKQMELAIRNSLAASTAKRQSLATIRKSLMSHNRQMTQRSSIKSAKDLVEMTTDNERNDILDDQFETLRSDRFPPPIYPSTLRNSHKNQAIGNATIDNRSSFGIPLKSAIKNTHRSQLDQLDPSSKNFLFADVEPLPPRPVFRSSASSYAAPPLPPPMSAVSRSRVGFQLGSQASSLHHSANGAVALSPFPLSAAVEKSVVDNVRTSLSVHQQTAANSNHMLNNNNNNSTYNSFIDPSTNHRKTSQMSLVLASPLANPPARRSNNNSNQRDVSNSSVMLAPDISSNKLGTGGIATAIPSINLVPKNIRNSDYHGQHWLMKQRLGLGPSTYVESEISRSAFTTAYKNDNNVGNEMNEYDAPYLHNIDEHNDNLYQKIPFENPRMSRRSSVAAFPRTSLENADFAHAEYTEALSPKAISLNRPPEATSIPHDNIYRQTDISPEVENADQTEIIQDIQPEAEPITIPSTKKKAAKKKKKGKVAAMEDEDVDEDESEPVGPIDEPDPEAPFSCYAMDNWPIYATILGPFCDGLLLSHDMLPIPHKRDIVICGMKAGKTNVWFSLFEGKLKKPKKLFAYCKSRGMTPEVLGNLPTGTSGGMAKVAPEEFESIVLCAVEKM